MNVAIIGCGLIGRKRAQALLSSEDKITVVCDRVRERAEALSKEFDCEFVTDWQVLSSVQDIDVVINSTINSCLAPITIDMAKNKKHVLCEKPLGRNVQEARDMVNAAHENQVLLKTGFNHRFHPAVWQAKRLLDDGVIGKCLTIRARYGHGGRAGMEKEWRSSKELCGGGELLDQGVHIIDLIRWFGGEITEVFGKVETKFWGIEVEDNAFAILKTQNDVTASFHVCWTNWKNVFSFEVFGDKGYLHINGIGGSYGPETLEFAIRKEEGGRPEIRNYQFPSDDVSWENEWQEFRNAVLGKRQPLANGTDGLKVNIVVDALYESSLQKKEIQLF
ncbi:MAG: Gfo/Idh/MocA family protein [bacterium]